MSVKTQFSKNDIIEMLSHYNVGALLSFTPLSPGSVQTNYVVLTTTGKFVLKYYENRTSTEVLYELALLKELHTASFPCVPPTLPCDKTLCLYQEKPYVLFPFIQGTHVKHPNRIQQNNLVTLIARLGRLTQNLSLPKAENRLHYNITALQSLALAAAKHENTPGGHQKLEWLMRESQMLILPDSLCRGICHCDYTDTNILYRGNEIHALLDFDDANETYLFFDIISFINFFAPSFSHATWIQSDEHTDILDFSQAKMFLPLFEKTLPIPALDKMHLYDILKLSILFDAVWYFKRGASNDFYEKRKIDALNIVGRERFFQMLFA
ncbi:MAG: phosphotransferase [Christensenellaceae bacterium]|jgi:homoserine kinase type II